MRPIQFLLLLAVPAVALARNSSDTSCLACHFQVPKEFSKLGDANICEDLFQAACFDENGKSKYADRGEDPAKELREHIKEAQNKTAKSLGFKDIDEAIRARLKDEGLELAETNGSGSSPGANRVYATEQECNKEWQEFQGAQNSHISDVNELKKIEKRFDAFIEKYGERMVALYAKDIPNFVANEIGYKCRSFTSDPETYKADDNPEVAKICGNMAQLRRRAVELFRLEGSPEYKERAERFVREYKLPGLNPSYMTRPATPSESEPSEADQIRNRIAQKRNEAVSICGRLSILAQVTGKNVVNEFLGEVNRAKTTVDGLLDAVYNEKNKARIHRIFEELKGNVQEVVKQLVKDPEKRARILDEYDKMKIDWHEKPPVSAYRKSDRGLLVLTEEFIGDPTEKLAPIFSDPSLSHFATVNAFYSPNTVVGGSKIEEERVITLPAFIYLVNKNAFNVLATIAHELAHKIDPLRSKLNKHDISESFRDLLSCYADPKSIRMAKGQEGEVVADAISAEILAHHLAKLPIEQRRQALAASVADLCYYEFEAEQNYVIYSKGAHPHPSFRVGGIYGANPSVRKAIGCEGESPKYKSCGLNLSLSGEEAKGPSGTGTSVESAR